MWPPYTSKIWTELRNFLRILDNVLLVVIPITDKNSNNIAMTFRGYDHGTESEWSGSTGGCQGVAKEGQDSRGAQSGTSHRVAACIGFEFGADSGRHWALGGRNLHNAYPVWSCAGGRKESNAQQARAAQPGQGQSGARGADTGRSAERCRNGWSGHCSSPEAGHRGPTWKAVGVVHAVPDVVSPWLAQACTG